ncbi:helix-turn-helix domain-containing protein [Flavobacterium sp.]|jgi:transcriptional regulator with XRE-family HTH domain|uniref:helix-turn-helix domain-containing protein n=1 Tax=Flavobacterium sp. TaxID=239 RepID=UPI0037BF8570
METFGDIIKTERENRGLILRQVASALDIDQAIVSKFERGERKPSKEQVEKFADYYNLDKNKLITSWLSDQIANTIYYEENIVELLKVAEEKAIYLKTVHNGK